MSFFFYLGVIMTPRPFIYLIILVGISLYAVYSYRKLSRAFQNLSILVFVTAISEIVSNLLKLEITNSYPPYHFLIPLLFFLHGFIYLELINPGKKNVKWIKAFIFSGILFTLVNTFFIQSILEFPSYSFSLLSLFIISLSMLLSKKMLTTTTNQSIFKEPRFWYYLGNFLFYPISFFVLVFINYFIRNQEQYLWLFDLLFTLNILLYGCYITAIQINLKAQQNG